MKGAIQSAKYTIELEYIIIGNFFFYVYDIFDSWIYFFGAEDFLLWVWRGNDRSFDV